MSPRITDEYKDSFASWLTRPEWRWSWVACQTFKPQFQSWINVVRDSWKEYCGEIAKSAICNYGFCFGEVTLQSRPHWHALLHVKENLFGDPRRKTIWKYAFNRWGRNTITPYRGGLKEQGHIEIRKVSDGIARYCAKYLAKGTNRQDAWWDFQGFISGKEVDPKQLVRELGLPRADF